MNIFEKLFKGETTKGIALGGGGIRGVAHLGVWKALKEKEIVPDLISGVSAGAIAGAFLANKRNPDDVLQLFQEQNIFNFDNLQIPKTGLMSLDSLRNFLEEEFGKQQLEDLPIPMTVTVSDLESGKALYFSEGPLVDLVVASASIPVLFSPVEYDGKLLVDGGLFDNLPVSVLKEECDVVIASNISPLIPEEKIDGIIEIANRVFQLTVSQNSDPSEDDYDLMICPEGIEKFGTLGTGKMEEIFELGYETVSKMDLEGKI